MMDMLPLIIESLVAGLLACTLGYCWKLNRRLEKMRDSEQTMKEIIAELVITTETAERAITNLRQAIGDCDQTLGGRLERAEQLSRDMSDQLRMGEDILQRIGKIALAVRGVVDEKDQAAELDVRPSRAAATAAAAEPLVNRVRRRQAEVAA
jgi:hypothetical protein